MNLENTIALLERTPATLSALLRDLPDAWTLPNEGDNTWSAFDVVGHLVHTERSDWLVRARIILQFGESRLFDPVDRWAQIHESQGKSLAELLDEFSQHRRSNLDALRSLNLQPAQFALRGRHPALGSATLSELLSAWAVHDLTHLHQIARVLAYQYRDSVGPWSAFLGVLKCNGHSAP